MTQVLLKIKRLPPGWVNHTVQWKKSQPFFRNPRGLLIHRVRSVITFLNEDGEPRHYAVHYLCGNQATIEGDFLTEPPTDRLLCENCEMVAKRTRRPSADHLAGRHVHVGRIKVEQTCCREEREAN